MFGTTYYDNVMSVFVLSGLAILIVNRETLARRARRAAPRGIAGLAGFITGMRHRSEAAGDAVLRRLRRRAAGAGRHVASSKALRLIAGGIGGVLGFAALQRLVDAAHQGADRQSALSLFQRILAFAAGAGVALSRPALRSHPFLARSFSSRSCSRSTGMSPTIWAFRIFACWSPISR